MADYWQSVSQWTKVSAIILPVRTNGKIKSTIPKKEKNNVSANKYAIKLRKNNNIFGMDLKTQFCTLLIKLIHKWFLDKWPSFHQAF